MWWTPTRAALREFAIVVLGVMAALGAQAWWEYHSERGRETAYLRQLNADARETELRLESAIRDDSIAAEATTRALAAMDGDAARPSADSLKTWIIDAGRSAEFRPLLGTYRAMVGTGDLRLIRNDSLRAALISYAASLEGEETRINQIRGVIFNIVPDFAREVPFLRRVFASGDPVLTEPEVDLLLNNDEASVVLFTMQAASVNRVSGLRRVRDEAAALRRLLDREVNRK